MGTKIERQIEEFEKDYNKVFDKGAWEPCDYTLMKDIQKIMYYLEVRDAMKKEEEKRRYEEEMSYGRSYGGYGDYGNSYAMNMPPRRYMPGNGNRTYAAPYGDYSGRRYYGNDKEDPVEKFRHIMTKEQDPEKRTAMEEIMRMIENK